VTRAAASQAAGPGEFVEPSDIAPAHLGPPPQAALAGLAPRAAAAALDALAIIAFMLAESVVILKIVDMSLERAVAPYYLSTIAFMWLYSAGLESGRRGATLGKRALWLEVVDLAGERPGFARASLRFAARAATFFVGWIAIPLTRRRQALHDLVAGTLVVRSAARPR